MTLHCPQCGGQTSLDPVNKWRPFCSERCRLLDLGAWADGSYSIPVEEIDSSVPNLQEPKPSLHAVEGMDNPKHRDCGE